MSFGAEEESRWGSTRSIAPVRRDVREKVALDARQSFVAQQTQKPSLAVVEELPDLQPATEEIDSRAGRATWPLVVDHIRYPRACDFAVHLQVDQMTVPPVAERSRDLQIAEMVIRRVVVDEREPA
jgi:hypothetical protein